MRCPQCAQRVLYKSGTEHRVRFKGMLVFGADGQCRVRCYHCNTDLDLPLRLQEGAPEALRPEVVYVARRR